MRGDSKSGVTDDNLINGNPLVSILIVTYNAEKTIGWTLASIFAQTYINYEILILDNNSSDNTVEVIERLKNPKIQIFSEGKNLGPYKGLNYLLDKANGKYIAIQDHDDVWYKEKIEKQVKFLEKHKDYVGCGTGCIDYYSADNTGYLIQEKECDDFLVYHTSLMFRNEGYRYDTSKSFLCDCYFMRYILCKNKKNLHIIPGIMSLHYNKKDGSNLSNYRFKLNKNNIKTYFKVYGYDSYHVCALIFISTLKIIPGKLGVLIQRFFFRKIKGVKPIEKIDDKFVYNMVSYLYNFKIYY